MYVDCLTAKVRAKSRGNIEQLVLTNEAAEELQVEQRTVAKSTDIHSPIRYGMSGDFRVFTNGEYSCFITEEGGEVEF